MTQTADWTTTAVEQASEQRGGWIKFAVGGVVILSAIVLLVLTSTQGNTQFYLSIAELDARSAEMVGKDARISGIVVPDSIVYDANTLHLEFDVVDSVGSSQKPLRITMDGQPLPDQMKDEAEAIAEGQLQPDGTFQAESLMMKCASKYETEVEQ